MFTLWYIPQVGSGVKTFKYSFSNLLEAVKALDMLYIFSSYEYNNRIKPDYCDMGGVQYWDVMEQAWYDVDYDALEWDDEYRAHLGLTFEQWESNKKLLTETLR